MQDVINAINTNVLPALVDDYAKWGLHMNRSDERQKAAVAEFKAKLSVEVGKKYVKIVQNRSVWGFVVAVDNDKDFPKGTILKAASWSGPTRNFGRGNVFTPNLPLRWAGL